MGRLTQKAILLSNMLYRRDMERAELEKSWKITTELLEKARQMLGAESDLSEYQNYIDHNELGLAFDALVAIGQERIRDASYWKVLASAAENMKLSDQVEICEKLAGSVV